MYRPCMIQKCDKMSNTWTILGLDDANVVKLILNFATQGETKLNDFANENKNSNGLGTCVEWKLENCTEI